MGWFKGFRIHVISTPQVKLRQGKRGQQLYAPGHHKGHVCTDVIPIETQVSSTMRTVSDLPFTPGWPAQVDILTRSSWSWSSLLPPTLNRLSWASPWLALLSRCQSPKPQRSGLPIFSKGSLVVFQIRLPDAARFSRWSVEQLLLLLGAASLEGRVVECGLAARSSATSMVVSTFASPELAVKLRGRRQTGLAAGCVNRDGMGGTGQRQQR